MSTLPRHDDAEKGTLDLVRNSPASPQLEKKGLESPPTTAALPVILPKTDKPKPAKKKVSRWILWQLWFNTYRKFFTFVVTFNMVGIVLAATGHWPYARKYTGPIVLGNLQFAILMRNELFGRFLYLFVNTLFAKVRYALSLGFPLSPFVRFHWYFMTSHPSFLSFTSNKLSLILQQWAPLWFRLGCTSVLQHLGGIHSGCATSGFFWLIFKVT